MKFFEILLIPQNKECLQDLLKPLELEKVNVMDLDVYRLEVDDELVMMLFDLSADQDIPDEILEHLVPHAAAALVVCENSVDDLTKETTALVDDVARSMLGRPVVMAIKKPVAMLEEVSTRIRQNGLFLQQSGRIFFWNPADKASIAALWKILVEELPALESA